MYSNGILNEQAITNLLKDLVNSKGLIEFKSTPHTGGYYLKQ